MVYSNLNVDDAYFADNESKSGSNGVTLVGAKLTGTKFTGQ